MRLTGRLRTGILGAKSVSSVQSLRKEFKNFFIVKASPPDTIGSTGRGSLRRLAVRADGHTSGSGGQVFSGPHSDRTPRTPSFPWWRFPTTRTGAGCVTLRGCEAQSKGATSVLALLQPTASDRAHPAVSFSGHAQTTHRGF